jgi:DNA-directed RNA polymerase sigma subunit (sigma70/sigma32)
MRRNIHTIPRYLDILAWRRQDPPMTFQEIGDKLGISRQRAWEIYQRALKRIKKSVTIRTRQDSQKQAA